MALGVRGLMNAQFVLTEPTDEPGSNVYVLEVNPRASRTVPFLSKVTGVPMVAICHAHHARPVAGGAGLHGICRRRLARHSSWSR